MRSSSALSDAQLWSIVTGAGWTGQEALKAFAVALAESGGRPDAYNGSNSNGSADHGLFQINSVHKALLASGDWRNPQDNARMAMTVYNDAGKKWTPWVAYKSGSYMAFMARAQSASKGAGASFGAGAGAPSGVSNIASDGAGSAADEGIARITSPNTWVRVAYFTVGALLLLIFAISLIKNTSIVKAATKALPVARVAKAVKGR